MCRRIRSPARLELPPADRLNEFGVFVPGVLASRQCNGQVVPPHPTVDRPDEIGQNLVAGHRDDGGVQSGVRGDKTFLVVVGERLLPGALELPEVLDVLRCRGAGRQPGGLRLEQGPHSEKLIGLGIGGGVDERAESGAKVHPALALHALQRLPNRLPADPELGRQLVFDQVRTRLQLTSDDHFDENVVHRLPQRCRTLQRRGFSQVPGGVG